jgi:hypothetical protein
MKTIKRYAQKAFCSRVIYAGLALAYGATCVGLDKEAVQIALTGLYAALVMARH